MEAFKSYIPGFNSSNEEHHQKHSEEDHEVHDTIQPNQGGGILSYIPGMGGGSTEQQTGNNAGVGVNEEQGGKGNTSYGRDQDTYDMDRVNLNAEQGRKGNSDYGRDQDTYNKDRDNYGNKNTGAYGSDAPSSDARTTRSGAAYNNPSDVDKYSTDSGDLDTGNQNAGVYNENSGMDKGYGKGAAGQAYGGNSSTEEYGKHGAGQGYGGSDQGYDGDKSTEEYGNQATGQTYGRDSPTDYCSRDGDQIVDTDAAYGAGYGNGSKDADNNNANTEGYGGCNNDYGGGNTDTGYHRGLDAGDDNGVRGAPIRGPNVKGYAVSAPVGREDNSGYDDEQNNGRPQGKVAGAHMQYGPVSGDDRDTSGRGTVSRTDGEGDSSYSNVKRDIPGGNEHVVSQTSSSRVQRTSFTQA
jgi:hypothetical protein